MSDDIILSLLNLKDRLNNHYPDNSIVKEVSQELDLLVGYIENEQHLNDVSSINGCIKSLTSLYNNAHTDRHAEHFKTKLDRLMLIADGRITIPLNKQDTRHSLIPSLCLAYSKAHNDMDSEYLLNQIKSLLES